MELVKNGKILEYQLMLPVQLTGRYSNVPCGKRICQHCDLKRGRERTAL
jgi:hypothetical protein